VRIDGSGRRQVTQNTRAAQDEMHLYMNLAWSPNGKRIAFVNLQDYTHGRLPDNGGRLFTILAGGGRETPGPRLAKAIDTKPPSTGWGFVPYTLSWSPDGRALAVAAEADFGVAIVRGSRFTVLPGSDSTVAPGCLAWSPDSSRLAFLCGDLADGPRTGGVASVTGGRRTVFTLGPTGSPVWSPDSSQLAFLARTEYDAPAQLYLCDRDGHHLTRVPLPEQPAQLFAWLPD
jgi:Tol biopolymer transport system component